LPLAKRAVIILTGEARQKDVQIDKNAARSIQAAFSLRCVGGGKAATSPFLAQPALGIRHDLSDELPREGTLIQSDVHTVAPF